MTILDVRPHSTHPYPPKIVRFKNGRPNLRATFQSLLPNQSITVRAKNLDPAHLRYAAVNARTRIRISHHISLNTVVVTSLGPHRKRTAQLTHIDPSFRPLRFQGWKQSPAPTAERHHQ